MLSFALSTSRDQTLDMFRAIAVLMVVLFHYTARLPQTVFGAEDGGAIAVSFGWVGVYFFFVLSGFCIFYTLGRSGDIISFFAKRFSRIYPAFFAAALLLFAVDQVLPLPLLPQFSFRESAPEFVDLLGNLLLLGGVFEWVNGSFWSITVEVQFYALVGLGFVLARDKAKFAWLFAVASLAIGFSWVLLTMLSSGMPILGIAAKAMQKIMIAPFLPFFALGILGVQLQQNSQAEKPFAMLFMQLMALSFVIILVTHSEGASSILTSQSLSVGMIMVGLIGVFAAYCVGWRMPEVPYLSAALAHIGVMSFSWYLLHENLGYLLLGAFGPHVPFGLAVLLAMLITYAAAIVFSNAVEWRYRKQVEFAFENVLRLLVRPFTKKMGDELICNQLRRP